MLLVSGWWDVLLDQTLDLHARLVAARREPRLLLGPWTHTSMVERAGWPVVLPEVLAFLRRHVDGEDVAVPVAAVRVHVGGDGWRELPAWRAAAGRARGLGAGRGRVALDVGDAGPRVRDPLRPSGPDAVGRRPGAGS